MISKYNQRNMLTQYIISKGIKVRYCTNLNCCNYFKFNKFEKQINVQQIMNNNLLFEYAHEIGHALFCLFINKIKLDFKKTSKYVLFNEFVAWVIGFVICVRFKINLHGFMNRSIYCLGTYIKHKG